MYRSFTFAGKDLYKDFGCYIDSVQESAPVKKEYKHTIPYRSGAINFNKIYKTPTYEERKLVYTVDVIGDTEEELIIDKMKMRNWLLCGEYGELIDSAIPGWHYLMECVEISETDEVLKGTFTITFKGYPFLVKDIPEGDVLWDSFCFETDVLQETSFVATLENTDVIIINSGANEQYADIVVTGNVNVTQNGKVKTWSEGRYSNVYLLTMGENTFTIYGDGTIEFIFYKESL